MYRQCSKCGSESNDNKGVSIEWGWWEEVYPGLYTSDNPRTSNVELVEALRIECETCFYQWLEPFE